MNRNVMGWCVRIGSLALLLVLGRAAVSSPGAQADVPRHPAVDWGPGDPPPGPGPVGAPQAPAADWVVTTTDAEELGDCLPDYCSLYQAINAANGSPGDDLITFDIPITDTNYITETEQWVIELAHGPLSLADPGTRIDGTLLDPCRTHIILDASQVAYGIEITGSMQVVSGLVITNAQTHGIYIYGAGAQTNTVTCSYVVSNTNDGVHISDGASDNAIGPDTVIAGNGDDGVEIAGSAHHNKVIGSYVGTDADGGSAWPNGGHGVQLNSGAVTNTVGMTTTGNLLSGNTGAGVMIVGPTSRGNVVQGNRIGTNLDGTSSIANGHGVHLFGATDNTVGPGNQISGNTGASGVAIANGATGNRVVGNHVGLDATGAISLPNQTGVTISDGTYNTVGPDNVISGNEIDGVWIGGGNTYSNTVKANFIGTNPAGNGRVSNKRFGIWIDGESHHNVIGTSNEGNLISGNGFDGDYGAYGGVKIHGADYNRLCDNEIGLSVDGGPLPNGWHGVWFQDATGDGAQYNGIGEDIDASCANLIAWNQGNGIYVQGSDTLFNTFGKINSIYSNDWLGIDNDQGGNGELEPPYITAYSVSSSGYADVGGRACPGCTVLVYSDDDGEGRYYETYTTADPTSGRFDWNGYPTGTGVTFLAIDAAGNTSEFSGAPVYLRLAIDDALPHVTVNKLPGDAAGPAGETIVEFVTQIYGYDDTLTRTFQIDLNVPNDVLGEPTRVFYRDQDSAYDGTPTISWTEPTTGTYRAQNVEMTGSSGDYSRRVVFRFGVPHTTSPMSMTVNATLVPPVGRTVAKPTDWAKLRILGRAGQIIVTNRTALYSNFPSSQPEVTAFLRNLYAFAQGPPHNWTPPSPIYYVDAYTATLAGWDNYKVDHTHEGTANVAAELVDQLIEDWVEDSPFKTGFICTRNYDCHVNLIDPPFLFIVGDDFVVPLYRKDDPTDKEKDKNRNTSNIVLKRLRDHDYFFTDNRYADLGYFWDGFHWYEGGVELATGRLIGSYPSYMSDFLRNGQYAPVRQTTPPRAIVASVSDIDADKVATHLSTHGYDVISDTETPSTVDTYGWDRADLLASMKANYMIMHHSHHSSENGWCTPPDKCGGALGVSELYSTTLGLSARLAADRPFLSSVGCRSGLSAAVPYYTTVATELANQGASAVMASTGIAFGDFGEDDYSGGEEFLREFYLRAVRHPKNGVLSTGSALRWTKRYWDGHWSVDDEEEKTGAEYILYGVPWVTLYYKGDPNAKALPPRVGAPLDALGGTLSEIQALGDNTYVITATFDASGYVVTHPDGYDLVEVPGMELARDYGGVPVIPLAETELSLPTGGSLIGVDVIASSVEDKGSLNLPALEPGIPSYPDPDPGGYTDTTSVGVYPPQDFVTRTVLMDGHWVARVYASPVSHDTTTGQTTVAQDLDVRITYHLSNTVALLGLTADPNDLSPSESFVLTATLSNPTGEGATVTGTLWIEDSLGQVVDTQSTGTFTVAAGGEAVDFGWALNAPATDGACSLYLDLYHEGQQQVMGYQGIQVSSGRIIDLTAPDEVMPGQGATVELTFANRQPGLFDGAASLAIYDGQGVLVEELTTPLWVAGDGMETVTFDWDTAGRSSGTYVVQAQVTGGGGSYGPMQDTVDLKHGIYLPLVMRQ